MNLAQTLRELNVQTAPSGHHHTTQNWINLDCPHCSPHTKKWRMGIHKYRMAANCWKCGPHPLIETVAMASNSSVFEVGKAFAGLTLESPKTGANRPLKAILPNKRGELQPAHRKYLKGRRFDPDEIASLWGVQGIGMAARLSWRLFIPARLQGEVVSWTTRAIGTEEPRYWSAREDEESYPLKGMLYGEDLAGHAVVVNEGPIDAWAVGPGGVATCGVGYTDLQLMRIGRYPVRAVMFDSDRASQKRAETLCLALSCFPGETHRVVLSGKDAASSPKSEIREVRKRFLK